MQNINLYDREVLEVMSPEELCEHFLPNAKVFSKVTQEDDEEAWKEVRTRGIGGSDVGTICSVNNFSSIRICYLQKTHQWDEEVHPFSANSIENMHWGHMLEPVVAAEYAKRNNALVLDLKATVVHKEIPWAIANIDKLFFESIEDKFRFKGILEVKTASARQWEDWDEGNINESYRYQLNWYQFVCGVNYGAFACLVGGQRFFEIDTYYYPELVEQYILPKADYFWNENVLKLIEPPMDGTKGAEDYLKEEYPQANDSTEITFIYDDLDETVPNEMKPNVNKLAASYINYKILYKSAKLKVETIKNQIKDQMKDHEIGYTEDHTIKWPNRSRTYIDSKMLKSEYPEVYDIVKYKKAYRDFRVK